MRHLNPEVATNNYIRTTVWYLALSDVFTLIAPVIQSNKSYNQIERVKKMGWCITTNKCKDVGFIPSLIHPRLSDLCVMSLSSVWSMVLQLVSSSTAISVLDCKFMQTGAVSPDRAFPSPQTIPSYSCHVVPEPFQGRVAWVLHFSMQRAQHWSTRIWSAKDQSCKWSIWIPTIHNLQSLLLGRRFTTLRCKQRKLSNVHSLLVLPICFE